MVTLCRYINSVLPIAYKFTLVTLFMFWHLNREKQRLIRRRKLLLIRLLELLTNFPIIYVFV